ncbi:MAG TPA: DUF4388 domain-containing protein [Planctomycetota bacterium]
MALKGDVKSIALANVLQDLASNEKTGTLQIRHKDKQVSLWFDKGSLRLVGVGPREGPSLLNGLMALEKITPEEAPAVTGKRTAEGGFIRSLVKKGKVSKDDLKAALEHQMGEHLCDAFLWHDATFEFDEGDPDDRSFDVDQLDLEPKMHVEAAIMEAVRRADEWGETRKAILSSNEILVPDPSRLPAGTEAMVRRVFGLLDGERSIRDIQDLTRLGQFMLLRAAAHLIRAGAARPVTAPEAFERARARAGKKEWDHALRMARYGLDHERKNLGLLELALRCCEALQDHEGAASYARQVAAAQVETGAIEAAVRTYQKVLSHAPLDLTAHERLFGLLLQLDLKLDALAAGEALAAAYKKMGLPDKALDVYRRLLEKVGDQVELLESVAEIQRHLGDKGEAVALYKKLMDKAVEGGDDNGALDYCRTILRIDTRNAEALDLRQRLESGQVEKARQMRRKTRLWTVGGVLVFLAGLAGVYEWRARSQYGTVENSIDGAMRANDLREALRLFDTVLAPYRFSVKAREILPRREKVEQDYVKDESERARVLEESGQLPEAIDVLRAALEVVRPGPLWGSTDTKRAKLCSRAEEVERNWRKDLAVKKAPDIEQVRDPLAVPALRELLGDAVPARRAAATAALGEIRGEAAVAALVRALADPVKEISASAAGLLLKRDRTPLQGTLIASRSVYGPGELPMVEWRIVNLSPAEVEISIEEPPVKRLRVTGAKGPIAYVPPEGGDKRFIKLGPGEFVGGGFPGLEEKLAPAGRYQLAWSASVAWQGKPLTLPSPPVAVERRLK